MTEKPIYLDYNATTPIDPEVAEAMLPHLRENFGNPSSSHWFGVQARQAVERARQQVADLLSCHTDEVVFTSGGSESNNFAIKGTALAYRDNFGFAGERVLNGDRGAGSPLTGPAPPLPPAPLS